MFKKDIKQKVTNHPQLIKQTIKQTNNKINELHSRKQYLLLPAMLLQIIVLDIIQTVRKDNIHKDNVFCNLFIICSYIIGSVYIFTIVAIFYGLCS